MQSPSFLSPFSLLPSQNPLTRKVNCLKACCFDDCCEILLVKNVRKLATSPPPHFKPTVCMCDSVCVSLDEKKIVVNSSCCILPATDICCCCCVMTLRLGRKIRCKWPIYLFPNYDYPSQLLFLENLESRERGSGKPAEHGIALKQPLEL